MRDFLDLTRQAFAQSWRAGALQKDLIGMVVMAAFIIVLAGFAGAISEGLL